MLKLIRALFGNKPSAPTIATDNLPPDALPYQIERIASAQQLEELKTSAAPNLVILIGDSHSVGNLSASFGSLSSTPEEILANASTFNLSEWVSADAKATALEELGTSLGEWPDSSPEPAPAVHPSLAENLIKRGTFVAIIPCHDSWAAPAYLPVGDLDQCPPPHIHVALAKKWAEQYGAEIVAITSYTIEYHVRRSPTNRDACEQLAWEHVLYAPESLGEQSIREYSHSLAADKTWLFLWD